METQQLPFKLSSSAAADWLQSLNQLNSVNSAIELNKVITQLIKVNTETKTVLNIFILFAPAILSSCTAIELFLSTNNKSNNDNKSRKIEKLCDQLLRHFSLAASQLADHKSLATEDQNNAIYIALQTIGFSQYFSTVFHRSPSSSLWKLTGELHILALEKNSFSQKINHTIKAFSYQATIGEVLKRSLTFSILAPYQCSRMQIKEIFLFAQLHGNLLQLIKKNTNKCCYFWNPDSHSPPSQIDKKNLDGSIAIDTRKLLDFIQSSNFPSPLDQSTFSHIVKQLSAYEEYINSALPSMLIINHILFGITDICDYLKKASKLKKIQQLSSQIVDPNSTNSSPSLSTSFDLEATTTNNTDNFLEKSRTAKILHTKSNQFIIAETNTIECDIGDILLLCSPDSEPEFGIIRQLKITNSSGTTHTLIEKVMGTPSLPLSTSIKCTDNPPLLIENENATPVVFLEPCKLSTTETITTVADKSYRLDQLIDLSPFYIQHLSVEVKAL